MNSWVFGRFGPNRTPYEFIDCAKAQGLGGGELTVGDCLPVEIDEATLTNISQITDGRYFRATNNEALKQVYEQIDQLEKTKMESMTISHANDLFHPFLLWAIILMMANIIIRLTLGRVLP